MKHYPFHYYLLYLVSRNETNTRINQYLEEKMIYALTKDEIEFYRKFFFSYHFPPSLLKIFKKSQRKITNVNNFYEWTKELKISEFWLLDTRLKSIAADKSTITQACNISKNKQARRVIELLILHERPLDEISASLVECDINIPPEAIRLYEHYFYNPKELSEEDWYEYYRRQEDNMKEIYTVSLRDDYNYSRWSLGLNPTLSHNDKSSEDIRKEAIEALGKIKQRRLARNEIP